jgi:hypothetical protein
MAKKVILKLSKSDLDSAIKAESRSALNWCASRSEPDQG